MRRHAHLLAGLLLLACLSSGCAPDARVWEPFEAQLPIAVVAANPFDPGEVAVEAEFRSPRGRVFRTPGFVYRDFSQSELPDGREDLTPSGDRQWRVRFTPTRRGRWSWRWHRTTPAGSESGPWQTLRVGRKQDPNSHGFVRRSRDSRHLRFDDGTSFFAVGENLSWYDSRGSLAYEDWMAKLAANGVNYIRLWMPSWAMGLVYAPAELDDWSARLDRAWQLDRVLELAAEHDIYVMLSVQNHGPFELGGFFGSGWPSNLFNAENGGPLAEPHEFFENDEAREIFRRYLRYVVARWGYSPHVMSFELWNEVNLAEQPDSIEPVLAWHREMAGEIRRHDPNRHLISTSTTDELMVLVAWLDNFPIEGFPLEFARLWELPEIDFVQLHAYQIGSLQLKVPVYDTLRRIVARLRDFGKPVLIAEAGVDFQGPAETLVADPLGEGFHDILWSGVFAGAFGSGMSWWWDNVVDPEDYYFHFAHLAELVRGVRFHTEDMVPETLSVEAGERSIDAHLLAGRRTLLAWLKNRDHEYFQPDRVPVEGAFFELPPLPPGPWLGRWLDPWSGEELGSFSLDGAGPATTLDVPTFSRDVALRLDKQPPWLR